MRIIFLPEVLQYFNELTGILYDKNYFGQEDSALKYVDDLLNNISTTLPTRLKRKSYISALKRLLFSYKKNLSEGLTLPDLSTYQDILSVYCTVP